jgi:hypothetical protein
MQLVRLDEVVAPGFIEHGHLAAAPPSPCFDDIQETLKTTFQALDVRQQLRD